MTLRAKITDWTDYFQASVARQPLTFFTLMALALIWISQIGAAHQVLFTGFLRDTDDAMRLVEVRDFLTGQNWFDLVQYRLDPPGGVLMHWSRLIDAPVAGLILFFRLFTSQPMAESIARLVWVAMLQAAFMATLLKLTLQMAGREALFPAAVFIGFGWILSAQFEPGRIDHHNVQLLLSGLLAVFALASAQKPHAAFFSGVSAALMISIGFESLAVIGIAGVYFLMLWIFTRSAAARLRYFGAGTALGTAALYFATVPPKLYFTVFCDAQSFLSLFAVCTAGLVAVALSYSCKFLDAPWKRMAGAGVLAAIAAICLYPTATACLAGPFAALPEDLQKNWLEKVVEAKGILQHLKENVWGYVPFAAPMLVGLACTLAAFCLDRSRRTEWAFLSALVVAHTALTFEHLRLITFACMFAVPACAWCVVMLRSRSQLAMAILYVASIPAVWALIGSYFSAPPDKVKTACNTPENYRAVADLPRGSILAPADMGPFLLADTPHSVFGAPYHRNVEGMRFSYNTLFVGYDEALPKLRARKPDYIVLCDGLGELQGIQKDGAQTFAARLLLNAPFPGLKKLDLKTPLLVWQIDYSALPDR